MQHPPVYFAQVRARHAFNEVVAANMFAESSNARDWANGWVADKLTQDKRDDPSFADLFDYEVSVTEWCLQDV